MKTSMDDYTNAKILRFGPHEDYVVTAAKFCKSRLSNPSPTHTRQFIAHTEPITHMKCNEVMYLLYLGVVYLVLYLA